MKNHTKKSSHIEQTNQISHASQASQTELANQAGQISQIASQQSQPTTRRKFFRDSAFMVAGSVLTLSSLNAESTKSAPQAPATKNTNTTPKEQTMKNTTAKASIAPNLTDKAARKVQQYATKQDIALHKTDTEFMENFWNFAYDEVDSHSALDAPTKWKLQLGAVIANDGALEFENLAESALKAGIAPSEIKEIIYQATAYIGFARTRSILESCNALFARLKIPLPLAPASTTTRENRAQKGLEAQRKLFGAAIDKGNASAPADVKHIRHFLSANCFGDYYTRSGLSLEFRELLTFVILASLGGADSQVKAHVQGNLNIGHDRGVLIGAVTAILPYIGYPKALNALSAIDELTKK
ncbi:MULTISPECIES: carboxymuconolactone decarboxylase family protein [unclassified Helicobacter]|uniref:carboxymuconolactone decarboxylase family protein n=1 Tax=unclassified Helicobacter TaxID=2593540 RepID=UPI000AFD714A|nr:MULTISPECIES: carboxymuconolactone decarboxylase family protein [unclassified Helicobacter]